MVDAEIHVAFANLKVGSLPTSSCIFEPTCAYCTVGSYASLSVRLSVCQLLRLDNNSYLRKYYS